MTEAQEAGELRPDLDPALFADGVISIIVAVLMATIQIGRTVLHVRGPALSTAFQAMFAPDPRLGS